MPVDPASLEEYDGKQVLLTVVQDDGSAKEFEGKIEAASAAGVAFKEKGKRDVELVEPNKIEEISLAPIKPKTLPQKKLKLVVEGTARQHLLDRHGYDRTVINKMTDEQALKEHDDIDHDDLGHKHVDPDDDDDESTDEESTEDSDGSED